MALIVAFCELRAIGARAGDVTLAANAVLYKMFTLGSYFLDGIRDGSGSDGRAGLWRAQTATPSAAPSPFAIQWSLGLGFFAMAVFWLSGPLFIDFITTDAAVRLFAREYSDLCSGSARWSCALAFAFRRHLYRRDLDAGHAQSDACIARDNYLAALGLGGILTADGLSNHGLVARLPRLFSARAARARRALSATGKAAWTGRSLYNLHHS